ncbi:hypothetical protein GCM10011380_16540 [Sphingomonas metalli]|uniref:Peptidase M56 domain-containing protein n=1 Tax=Sphingomonas metalli TaxID=1779358 RepID=A0A916WRG6_9SPHN|nr:M56 family metallopeptidase [Sphingomonas metalli]GGB27564.1 hypothetical protein GCM10011380_16540 [Sphingomonas metalli]
MIAWLTEALVASALLMLLVLLVRAPVRRVFGPQVAYALWALPVLRLVTPPLPAAWREQAVMPISRAGEAVSVMIAAPVATPLVEAAPAPAATGMAVAAAPAMVEAPSVLAALPLPLLVAGLWAVGAGGFFLYHFLRHRRFCRGLLRAARTVDEVDGVRVVETPAAAGPLAFGLQLGGLGRRFVAFPDDFADRYDPEERELALAHELGHHARGDLFANWIGLAVLAIHWFNPLAWRAFRAFRADQELANDARVLAGRSRADRHIYACAIVKAAHGGAVAATCHLHTISDLKGRLRMLSITRLSRARLATGATAVAGLVATGLLVTASGTEAAAAITAKVEDATGVRLAAPPVPPVPAVPAVSAKADLVAVTRKPLRVVVKRAGTTQVYEGTDASRYLAQHPLPPLPPMPATPVTPVTPVAAATAPRPPVPPRPPVAGDTVVINEGQTMIIRNGDCTPPTGPSVVQRDHDGRREMVVCRNRISAMAARAQAQAQVAMRQADRSARVAELQASAAERQAADAERQAHWAERSALASRRAGVSQALASIDIARRSIEANRSLTAEQRHDALAGLQDAQNELRDSLNDE